MRILFGHGRRLVGIDVMPQIDIVKSEVNGRAMRKMRYDHCICLNYSAFINISAGKGAFQVCHDVHAR
jgi:hypothetical protein